MDWAIEVIVLAATALTIGSGVWVAVSLVKAISVRGVQAAEKGEREPEEKERLR